MRNWNKTSKKQINYIWKTGRFIGPKPGFWLFNFVVKKEKRDFNGEIIELEIEANKNLKPNEKEVFILPLKDLKFNS